MSKSLRIQLVTFFFISIYLFSLLPIVQDNYNNNFNIIAENFYYFIIFIYGVYIIYKLYEANNLYTSIVLKILIFSSFCFIYFIAEYMLIKFTLYSIGGTGGYIRDNIYEQIDYIFSWYEVLFWNFIFSLYYPIYIFIFIRPFVNHLSKSINDIKNKVKGDRQL